MLLYFYYYCYYRSVVCVCVFILSLFFVFVTAITIVPNVFYRTTTPGRQLYIFYRPQAFVTVTNQCSSTMSIIRYGILLSLVRKYRYFVKEKNLRGSSKRLRIILGSEYGTIYSEHRDFIFNVIIIIML